MTRPARGALAAALACAGFLAGCGGGKGSDEDAVRRVLSDLQAASRAGDGRRICSELFTPKLADSVARSSRSRDCPTEVRDNLFSTRTTLDVKKVEVEGTSDATATVTEANGNTSTVLLVKQGGHWRIRGVRPA